MRSKPKDVFENCEKKNLQIAIEEGIYFNLDNVDEILKVDDLLKTTCKGKILESTDTRTDLIRQVFCQRTSVHPCLSIVEFKLYVEVWM